MKFSVLLPTRNGGNFLRDCIASILAEPYQDMELVVSDNANIDQTPSILHSFSHDKRLKVVRLENPVSVTDNWNHALKASLGDYILMMGDDDCLLPGYFKRLEECLRKFNYPDCVTYNAYTYLAPDSINGNIQSYYNKLHFRFGPGFKAEGLISAKMRASIARDMFRFRVRIPLNMQTTLVSRKASMNIEEGMFQPPFPDHYALNALLLNVKRWVYVPENLLIVGVSPKSFGHFVFSNQQGKGLSYLGIGADFKGRLPGNELVNYMYIWLELLKMKYRNRLKGVKISRSNYVRRQVYYWYMQYKSKGLSSGEFKSRLRLLSLSDSLALCLFLFDRESWLRLWRMFLPSKNNKICKGWFGLCPIDNVLNIRDFSSWVVTQSKPKTQ